MSELPLGGLLTAADLFEKLKRDANLLDEEVTSDRLFNFVITGYSLIDWIKNDPSVPSTAKETLEIERLYTDPFLKICGDLATGSKHFTLTRRDPIVQRAPSVQGYGLGRYGKGSYGKGEESICIQLKDGTQYHCPEFVQGVVSAWQEFLYLHSMI